MTTRRLRLTTFDRAAIAVVLFSVCTLLLELTWQHDLGAPMSTEAVVPDVEPIPPDRITIGDVSLYHTIGERPLFARDRRPFVIAVETTPMETGPRAEFELTAVIITSTMRMALLRSSLTPTVQRVVQDQSIDGWTLIEVTPSSVRLQRDVETMTVPLRPDLGSARVGQAIRIEPAAGMN